MGEPEEPQPRWEEKHEASGCWETRGREQTPTKQDVGSSFWQLSCIDESKKRIR